MKNRATISPFFVSLLLCLFQFHSSFSQANQQTNKYPATLLWRITGNGMSKPSYLFGTMHLTDKRLFFFGDSLYKAIEQTDGFAIEVNPDEMSTQLIQSFTKEDNSGYLKDSVDKEDYDRIKKTLQKKYGFNVDKLTKRQAYLARNEWMKEMRKDDDMYTFMDAWLYNIARQLGKWTGGIEDLNDQLQLIEKEQADFNFEDLLISKKVMQGGLNQIVEMYLSQDLQSIDQFFNSNIKNKRDEWLTKRNVKMAQRIDSLMKLRTGFFAIGAAHLAGNDGVIQLLQKKGFRVEPVFSSQKISPDDYKVQSPVMKWQQFIPDDSLYNVSFPSKSATMFVAGNVLKMQMCIDIPTATYYLTAAVPKMRKDLSNEKLIDEMLKGFTKGGKVLSRKPFNDGADLGTELLVDRGGFMRVKIFIKGNYAFMAIAGHETKKEMITGEMGDHFFSSFSINEKNVHQTEGLKTYTNEEDGYSILLPQLPDNVKTETDTEGWRSKSFGVFDIKNGIYFMVMVRSTAPGFYLNGDSNYFSLQRSNWKAMTDEVKDEKYFNLGEFPAMQYDFVIKNNKEKALAKTITINRGNRSYLLLAIIPLGFNAEQAVNVFFNSFQLTDYKKANWKTTTSPDGVYSTYVPAPVTIKRKSNAEETKDSSYTYVAYDSLTAVSYELTKVSFVDYYHAVSDSAVFHDALATQIEGTDSVISTKYVSNGNDKAQDVILKLKVNQNLRRVRMVLHGDTMYIAYAFLHPALINTTEVNRHFDELKILTPGVTTSIFNNRTNELLNDLTSGDSTRFAKAADRINNVDFSKEDLPMLKDAIMKQYDYADGSFEGIYNSIADVIAELNDSTIVSFVRKKYFSPNLDNEAQKVALLRLLANTKTNESFSVLKDLLISDPPYTDYLYPLQSVLSDSLQLTKILFPDVMRLSSDTLYTGFTALLANNLLDSSYITVSSIKEYEINFRNAVEKFMSKPGNEQEEYDYSIIEISQLLARFNSAAGNAILQKLILKNRTYINSVLIPELLYNKQVVPKELINTLAATKDTRYSFYYRLQQKGLTSFFPAKYATQKSLAESDVYNMASDEDSVEEVVYLNTKVSDFNGASKRFFIYKVKVGDAWYIGFSGGYEMDDKILRIKDGNDVGGIYWDEEYNSKKVDEFFDKWMSEAEE